MRSPTVRTTLLSSCEREAEVDNFDLFCLCFKQYVVKLEIAVSSPPRMHVSNSKHKLSENNFTILLSHPLVRQLLHVMVQWHSVAQFHHKVNFLGLIDHLKQPHNVRMFQRTQIVNFVMDSLFRLTLH